MLKTRGLIVHKRCVGQNGAGSGPERSSRGISKEGRASRHLPSSGWMRAGERNNGSKGVYRNVARL